MSAHDLTFLGGGALGLLVVATALVRATSAFNALSTEIALARAAFQLEITTIRAAAELHAVLGQAVVVRVERLEGDVDELQKWRQERGTGRSR